MTSFTIEFDTKTINYISKKNIDTNTYLLKLIREDMLLNEIQESKRSGSHAMSFIDDLDDLDD